MASPAISLQAATQEFLSRRLANRQALASALQTSDLALWDPYPYRAAPGDDYGYPNSAGVETPLLNAVRGAVEDRTSLTKAQLIGLHQEHTLLEGFKRSLSVRRLRKYHSLTLYRDSMATEEVRHLALQGNLGPVTARRLASGIG